MPWRRVILSIHRMPPAHERLGIMVKETGSERARHIAARFEDRLYELRAESARERGLIPTVLPYTGYGLSDPENGWVRIFARVLLAKPGAFEDGRHLAKVITDGVRGWRNFMSPILPHGEIEAHINGERFKVQADRGGVVDVRVAASLEPGWNEISLHVEGGPTVTAPIVVVDGKQEFGVLSDVDDTVVVTALPRPLLLTDWGATERGWFRSGMQHKADQLRRLAAEFPNMKWLLIGDDGQHDPYLYAEFARRYPRHVEAIVIRQLTPSEAVLAGGRSQGILNSTPGVPWVYEPDGSRIAEKLEGLGIISPDDPARID